MILLEIYLKYLLLLKATPFSEVKPNGLVDNYKYLGGAYYLHLLGRAMYSYTLKIGADFTTSHPRKR
jgi:hypothetical protein